MNHDPASPGEPSPAPGPLAPLTHVRLLGESFAQGGLPRFSEVLARTGVDLGLSFAEVSLQRDQQREVLASEGTPGAEKQEWLLTPGNGELLLRGTFRPQARKDTLEALLEALRPWLAVILAAPLHQRSSSKETARRLALTRAQTRVLDLLLQGLSNKAIAERLRCSTKTVEAHTTRILRGAGVSSRSELLSRLFMNHEAGSLDSMPGP